MRRHDRLCARSAAATYDGQEIDKTDGFLLLFERPIQAVAFALDYQRLLRELGEAEFLPLRRTHRHSRRRRDAVGQRRGRHRPRRQARRTRRLGQTGCRASDEPCACPGRSCCPASPTCWRNARRSNSTASNRCRNGARTAVIRFKGVDEPVPVFEVGEGGIAPLRAPALYRQGASRSAVVAAAGHARRRSRVVLALASLCLLYISLRSPPAIAFAKRDWVVVGDLKNLTERTDFQRFAADRIPHRPGTIALRQRAVRPEGARHDQADAARSRTRPGSIARPAAKSRSATAYAR